MPRPAVGDGLPYTLRRPRQHIVAIGQVDPGHRPPDDWVGEDYKQAEEAQRTSLSDFIATFEELEDAS
jgi:hypothetical protein